MPHWNGLVKDSARASVALFFWLTVFRRISFFWMNRRRGASRGRRALDAGYLGVLEAGARKGLVSDLRQAYIDLLRQGIRFDVRLLQASLARLGLPKL